MYKNMWWENILAHAHLWCESTQIEYSSRKMARQVWQDFSLNNLLIKSNCTALRTRKELLGHTDYKKLKKKGIAIKKLISLQLLFPRARRF